MAIGSERRNFRAPYGLDFPQAGKVPAGEAWKLRGEARRGTGFLPAALLALFLGPCGCLFQTERTAGAEDFPNTLEPLGAALSSQVAAHADWDQFDIIPSSPPAIRSADSLTIPLEEGPPPEIAAAAGVSPAEGHALAKAAAPLADSVRWDLSDTAAGLARKYLVTEGLLKDRRDTLIYRFDAAFRDGIPGNEVLLEARGRVTWRAGMRVQSYRFLNVDGEGPLDRAVYYNLQPGLDGVQRHHLIIMLPGQDGDLMTTGDNVPGRYVFARVRGADTLELMEVTDADGDGSLWGAGDSGMVEVVERFPEPPLRPLVSELTRRTRAVIFADERAYRPLAFREDRLQRDGQRVTFSVRGLRADSTFRAGDTVAVAVDRHNPEESPLAHRRARYTVLLADRLRDYRDSELLEFAMAAQWRQGPLRSTRLRFLPESPVTAGELSIAGGLEMEIDFADGRMGSVAGSFQGGRFEAVLEVEHPDGRREKYAVDWDARGRVLRRNPMR